MFMTRHRWSVLFFIVIIMSAFFCSCIIIDDDDDDDDEERINYYNNTPYHVDCYIDDDFRGTVYPTQDMTIWGDFEGTHKYYAETNEVNWEWGPDYFSLYDGETLNISLDPPN